MEMIFGKTVNMLLGLVLALSLSFAQVANADHIYEGESFYGGWSLSNRVSGNVILGDGNGWGLDLRSTERYCATPGTGYSTMQQYIRSNSDGLSWFVDNICNDGYVRVCVYSSRGNLACSTYIDYGWRRLD